MEEKRPKTACECPLAGLCTRHGINKTEHFHKLCQNHEGYFKMWENCRGPGQNPHSCSVSDEAVPQVTKCQYCGQGPCNGECRNDQVLPSKVQMAKNLAVSAKDHAMSGFKTSTEEEVAKRLEICAECPHYIPQSSQCKLCGCFTKFKAKLKSGKCPDGRW